MDVCAWFKTKSWFLLCLFCNVQRAIRITQHVSDINLEGGMILVVVGKYLCYLVALILSCWNFLSSIPKKCQKRQWNRHKWRSLLWTVVSVTQPGYMKQERDIEYKGRLSRPWSRLFFKSGRYVLGHESMKHLQISSVLVSGLRNVRLEISKNYHPWCCQSCHPAWSEYCSVGWPIIPGTSSCFFSMPKHKTARSLHSCHFSFLCLVVLPARGGH